MKKRDKRTDRIDQEVSRTIESLADLEDIEVGPHFFTRLKARLDDPQEVAVPWLLRSLFAGRLAPSLLALVVVLNIVTALIVLRSERSSSADSRDTNVQALADQYLLTGTSTGIEVSGEEGQ